MDTSAIFKMVEDHVVKSWPEYTVIFGLLLVAIIANMPKPDVIDRLLMDTASLWIKCKELVAILYRWVYESLQAFMAARHPQPPPTVVTTAPVVVTPNPTREKE